jgi:hypothetical protein
LLRKISDLKIKCLEREIAAHEEFLSTYSARDEVYAEKSEQLRAAKVSRAEILIADAQERVAGIRPIYSSGLNSARTFSMPGGFVRLCRNCSARDKIRTRV